MSNRQFEFDHQTQGRQGYSNFISRTINLKFTQYDSVLYVSVHHVNQSENSILIDDMVFAFATEKRCGVQSISPLIMYTTCLLVTIATTWENNKNPSGINAGTIHNMKHVFFFLVLFQGICDCPFSDCSQCVTTELGRLNITWITPMCTWKGKRSLTEGMNFMYAFFVLNEDC